MTIQNTTTSVQDPLPGHQGHQAAVILPPRSDGKLWVGTVTWASSKLVELVVLNGYNNVSAETCNVTILTYNVNPGAEGILKALESLSEPK